MIGAPHRASGPRPHRARVAFASAALCIAVVTGSAMSGCADAPTEHIAVSSAALTANDKTAFDYFIDQGLSGVQAAGIVGNLDVESGMDPTSVQSGGPGRGIAQWSSGGRWDTTPNDNVIDYATMKGEDHLSLALQLEFIWYELTTFPSYGLAKLRAATTVSDAVAAFLGGFEGCGACASSLRVTDAQNALTAYGADVPSDAGTSSPGVDAATITCVVTPTGASGECIATAACDALGGHVSTPGYCPGAADIQCCTAVGNGGGADGGSPSSAGGPGAASPTGASDSGGGCSAAQRAPDGGAAVLLVLAVLAAVAERRRPARASLKASRT